MGVSGQEPDILTLLAYCQGDRETPLLFAVLVAALREGRPDVRIEHNMVRCPTNIKPTIPNTTQHEDSPVIMDFKRRVCTAFERCGVPLKEVPGVIPDVPATGEAHPKRVRTALSTKASSRNV